MPNIDWAELNANLQTQSDVLQRQQITLIRIMQQVELCAALAHLCAFLILELRFQNVSNCSRSLNIIILPYDLYIK